MEIITWRVYLEIIATNFIVWKNFGVVDHQIRFMQEVMVYKIGGDALITSTKDQFSVVNV